MNSFSKHTKRLEELQIIMSESTYASMFVNKITRPDYRHVVKPLKCVENLTLEKCYRQVIIKATDLEKPPYSVATMS